MVDVAVAGAIREFRIAPARVVESKSDDRIRSRLSHAGSLVLGWSVRPGPDSDLQRLIEHYPALGPSQSVAAERHPGTISGSWPSRRGSYFTVSTVTRATLGILGVVAGFLSRTTRRSGSSPASTILEIASTSRSSTGMSPWRNFSGNFSNAS